ncbi:CinA family nicotinamide mononucleotide deamidase-related protein [Deinococcus maricopensis]|uniref:CinA-like protein n=1 Tax=Deinococcus maricopensis (strain DSM 21211 / LMG 22137 / NRRL B-23946 / LB-34) TaxID=709986 RepID=E8UBN5_DEIML|nr:CinA family nicotinamide mononucleotide deamidase-related protein [Deinococcus maricopensis]ADV68474.1 competence/damage-inducible protein CinA [Deinococcus maricopensis DSM 21211]
MSVGTELLLGEILDSNAAYLAQELKAHGVTLHRKVTVGDNLERLREAILTALDRADLVILGGGLGPTDDDLTREAIAAALGEHPTEDPDLLAWLRGLFESRGRIMPDLNRKQAWLIPSSEALPNPIGTAPGWFVRVPGHATPRFIVAMPGPPREMKRMWREQVLPRLNLPARALFHTTLHTSGIGEGNVAELLGDLTRASNPSVATYARRFGVDVRVAASASTTEAARALAEPVLSVVQDKLARFTWGTDDQTLAGVLHAALGERTVAAIEAGSGGALALHLADTPAFRGGLVTRDHAQLIEAGLTPVTLGEHGPVSEQAARELARTARARFGSNFGVAVTVATGSSEDGPACPGTAFVAVDTEGDTHTARFDWLGEPDHLRDRAAILALTTLLRAARAEVPA